MADRITDPQPPDVVGQLANLSAALDQVIPAKQPGSNLLLGTWNVRAFERLTPNGTRQPATPPSATSATCCASPRSSAASTSSPSRRSEAAPKHY